jgi:hypothetical protein
MPRAIRQYARCAAIRSTADARHADSCVCLRRYNNQLLQLTISCLYLAAIVGALGSELARPLGRKVGSPNTATTHLLDPVPHPAELLDTCFAYTTAYASLIQQNCRNGALGVPTSQAWC